jgi:hypothetical protein
MPDPNESRMFQVTPPTDPALKAIGLRVLRTLQLAAEKAVAHHADPQAYPMPADAGSLEATFLARLSAQPAAKRQLAISRVMPRVTATAAQRTALYGELAAVDLRVAKGVATQAAALPGSPKISPEQLRAVTATLGAPFGGASEPLTAIPEN